MEFGWVGVCVRRLALRARRRQDRMLPGLRETDAAGLDDNPALPEEHADGLFERLLAHAEGRADFLRRTDVEIRRLAAGRLQCGENLRGERPEAAMSREVEAEVDFPIGQDRADEAV